MRGCVIVLGLILAITSTSYFVFEPATLKYLAQEDGWVENLSAANWLLAAGIMFVLFARQRNVWYLLLGILFAVCMGEEISWGQRLFGFATPESVQAVNFQGEFNLHNLNFFDRRSEIQSIWSVMRDMTRLFAFFWFMYGIVLPLSLRFSDQLRRLVQTLHLPVMPLTLGVFFLVNYAVFQYFEDVHKLVCAHLGWINKANSSSLPVEIREWFDSLLFLVFVFLIAVQSRTASISADAASRITHRIAVSRPESGLGISSPSNVLGDSTVEESRQTC
jgi:hypothetical protein